MRRHDPDGKATLAETLIADDVTLVLRARDGNRSAFSRLVREHEALALATAAGIIPDSDAVWDVVQDAFLVAWERIGQLQKPENFGGWLRTIVRNKALSWTTAAQRRAEYTDEFDVGAFAQKATDGHSREAERQSVWQAVHALPMMYREVVLAHYLGGYTQKEIARTLGIPVTTVNGRLHQARLKLKGELTTVFGKERSMTHTRVKKLIDDAVRGGRYREALEHIVSLGIEEMNTTLPENDREELARSVQEIMNRIADTDDIREADWGEAPDVNGFHGEQQKSKASGGC